MKIAVIGAGISGLACAAQLSRHHAVTLYEANTYLGGHTHTVDARVDGVTYPVDTGFLVFNERTYPRLIRLFGELGIATAQSEMSFSVRVDGGRGVGASHLEWAGTDLNSVFAQRMNLARPRFLRMLADIVRFNRAATRLAVGSDDAGELSLGSYLDREGYSRAFRDWYLLPMAGAIWSCPTDQMAAYPLATFVRFCHNHGLLQIANRPKWFTVTGGARQYVERLAAPIGAIRMDAVTAVLRGRGHGVTVHSKCAIDQFDEVVLACHSDQALALLAHPTEDEKRLLSAIRYQANVAYLHWDESVLPRMTRAWAAWNYHSDADGAGGGRSGPAVHYLINRLQPTPFRRPVIVSLNPLAPPRDERIVGRYEYAHPVFDARAIAAQKSLQTIQGRDHIWFAGAWTGYGFHEDGLASGQEVAARIEAIDTGGDHAESFPRELAAAS